MEELDDDNTGLSKKLSLIDDDVGETVSNRLNSAVDSGTSNNSSSSSSNSSSTSQNSQQRRQLSQGKQEVIRRRTLRRRRRRESINTGGVVRATADANTNEHRNHHPKQQPQPQSRACQRRRRHALLPDINDGHSKVFLPRLVQRDSPFHQSSNQISVQTVNTTHTHLWLRAYDWFHVLLRVPILVALILLIAIWTMAIVGWGGMYVWLSRQYADRDCGFDGRNIDGLTFPAAWAFALETATTIGYGLPNDSNSFFEHGCGYVQATIYFQMLFNMLFNAFMISFFYSQLSKSENRAIQLIFSNKLIVHVDAETEEICLSLRCYDVDSAHPVVEAHVRVYVLDRTLKYIPLRTIDPNDAQHNGGGWLLPSIPLQITHIVDHHSALSPPASASSSSFSTLRRYSNSTRTSNNNIKPFMLLPNKDIHTSSRRARGRNNTTMTTMRSIDSVTGERKEVVCTVCGMHFGTYELFAKHIEYNTLLEEYDNYPSEQCHRSLAESVLFKKNKENNNSNDNKRCYYEQQPDKKTLQEVKQHIESTMSEIIVVVEGIDPQLSGSFRSMQSYKYDDIVFGDGAEFEHCMTVQHNNISVDMVKFHNIIHEEKSFSDCCF